MKAAERPLRPAEAPRAAVWRGGGVRRTSNRNAGSFRAFLLTRAQRLRVDRVEHRTADRVDHRDDHLQATRRVEHDSIEVGATAGHGDEVTYLGGLHNSGSLPVARHPGFAVATTVSGSPGRYGLRIDPERQRSQDRPRISQSGRRRPKRRCRVTAPGHSRVRARSPERWPTHSRGFWSRGAIRITLVGGSCDRLSSTRRPMHLGRSAHDVRCRSSLRTSSA